MYILSSNCSYQKKIIDLYVDHMSSSRQKGYVFLYKDQESAELASRAAMEHIVHRDVPQCITPASRGRGKYKRCFEDDDCSDDGVNVSSGFYNKFLERECEYKNQLLQKDNEISHLKAIVRQYRAKAKKARALAMAGIDRENYLLEGANANLERGLVLTTEVESDVEDQADNNRVFYSYIDNELFNSED